MKGTINIPVGRYEFVDGVVMIVRGSDAGAVVSIIAPDSNIKQTAVIDENGQVVAKSGQSEGVSAEAILAAVLRTGPRNVAKPSPPPVTQPPKRRRKARVPDRVKFVISDGKEKRRPKNYALVLGGFQDGNYVQVIYRIVAGEAKYPANQIRLTEKKIIFASQIPRGHRLPQARFVEVCHLPERATFKIGRKTFRTMNMVELKQLLNGRTLQIGPPKSG